MSDLAKWKVHGPVKTLSTELALTSFDPEGKVSTSDFYNPDGSIFHSRWLYDDAGSLIESNSCLDEGAIDRTVYFYDEAGRHHRTVQKTTIETSTYDALGLRTQIKFLSHSGANVSYGIEGSEQSYGAPGAARMVITGDKVLFQDENGQNLRAVTLVRDSAGRLIREEVRVEPSSLPLLANVPEEFAAEFNCFTTYTYDARGRRLERIIKFGSISESRTTWQYEDRDDPITETTEAINRELSCDDEGVKHFSPDRVSIQHTRFEYVYDTHGNWTERIVSNPDCQSSNIERRVITYY